jgi:predicted DNA-binding transcriptional regulator AlpA
MATMETPVLSKRVLRQREAAHYLSCSESTLEKLRVFGGGPVFVKIGARTVGYIVEDLERWLATADAPARASRRGENLGRVNVDARILERHLDLSPLRGRRRGLTFCLFHQHRGRTPSMSVDLDEGLFFCFACGAKGGVKAFRKLVWETQPTPRPAAPRPPQSEWAETWRSAVELKGRERAQHQAWAP